MFICIKVSKWEMGAQCHGNAATSLPSAGDPVPVHSTDICASVEPLLCGGCFALGYDTEEVKPLAERAYILVRKTKNKTKGGQKHEKLHDLLMISAKKKKESWVRKEASMARVGISQEKEVGDEARHMAVQTQGASWASGRTPMSGLLSLFSH